MNILLTGVTGYIAQRLLPALIDKGHQVICCVRDKKRFRYPTNESEKITLIEVDFLDKSSLEKIPKNIDIAYYMIHSMATESGDFEQMEATCAKNFVEMINHTNAKQLIYLGGVHNTQKLSKHLSSRKNVGEILASSQIPLTCLNAGIIVGSGSASFEIIRDLVEKLPVMVTPKWLKSKCQPIAIRNVIDFLIKIINRKECFGKSFDIGGNEVLTYKEMLLLFAKTRGLKRKIWMLPVMTPKLSSYWLYFVTSTSYPLAKNLVSSLKNDVICTPNSLAKDLNINLISYEDSIRLAFDKMDQNQVISSWKDAQTSKLLKNGISAYIEVPTNGCFVDKRQKKVNDINTSLEKIWAIGGKTGWYCGNFLWEIRGILDQMVGGVGMRRGRKNQHKIYPGETLDFWRVMVANKKEKRLLLYAEMKLPGEAWLEFKIDDNGNMVQTATFRPLGLWGRCYWYAVLPFHGFIFNGMLKNIAK